jgi:predicted O-methyltransferase YrrM
LLKKIQKFYNYAKKYSIKRALTELKKFFQSKINRNLIYQEYINSLQSLINNEELLNELSRIDFKNLEDIFNFSQRFYNGIIAPMQFESEFLQLLKILKDMNVQNILEIGTARGGTLFCFCKVLPTNSCIISIDLPFYGIPKYEKYDNLILNVINRFKKTSQELHLIRSSSHSEETLIKVKEILKQRELDFLFIDGDHSYEGTKMDFDMYSPLVKKGGIIAIHDIAPKGNIKKYTGYTPIFWKELKECQKYKYMEIIENPNQDRAGIGIIFT